MQGGGRSGGTRAPVAGALALTAALLALAAASAGAATRSLYSGPGPRPGPDLLYRKLAVAPQLTSRGVWKAKPILVSGGSAYRRGEFLYQDYLYDDSGAREAPDPNDPRAAGNLFSKPNGTYTYPTDKRYAANAADLVELRVKPLRHSTAFRVTLNTFKDPSLVAFTIAIGSSGKTLRSFPYGANVRAPARYFLTVRPHKGKLRGQIVRASDGGRVRGNSPPVRVDRKRRQIEVRVAHKAWNPRHRTVRLAAGVGLWDGAHNRYLLPQASADATHPGGAGTASKPAAFFNVAFRSHEPFAKPTEGLAVLADAAWWRDRQQGTALAGGDIRQFHANVSFRKLAKRRTDNHAVPHTGAFNRILASHFERQQGNDFSQACIASQTDCPGEYQGRLQPYAIYVPHKKRPAAGWGMTLLLHSLSANYNQYSTTRNQTQFGERGPGSIVITPEGRGPDEFYKDFGAADTFEVWADVARRYRLNPDWTAITGYSMGGYGTFTLGAQFPDLFARAQPTVGTVSGDQSPLASFRNLPVEMWNTHGDELVPDLEYMNTAAKLDSLGYRYELKAHRPCANPQCSPLFPNHLELAVNDQYAPAAAFLGTATVDRNPAHVTYFKDASLDHGELGLVGDHAYWVSGVKLRSGSSGQVDVFSHGFGSADPPVSPTQIGLGTLSGGNLGDVQFDDRKKTWGPPPPAPVANRLDVNATGVSAATVDPARAHVGCDAQVNVTSDGPIDVTLAGCNRTVHADGGGSPLPIP